MKTVHDITMYNQDQSPKNDGRARTSSDQFEMNSVDQESILSRKTKPFQDQNKITWYKSYSLMEHNWSGQPYVVLPQYVYAELAKTTRNSLSIKIRS